MAPQATAALKTAVLHLRKSGISAHDVTQQTGVKERTQRRWIAAAKKSGTWAGRQHEGVLEDAWQEHRPSHQAL